MPPSRFWGSTLLGWVLLLCGLGGHLVDGSFSVTVEYGEEECLTVKTPMLSTISGNFDCLDPDLDAGPVTVYLYDSKMQPVWRSKPGASEGTFSVRGKGKYQLCIENGVHDDDDQSEGEEADRDVGFSIRVRPVQFGGEGSKDEPDEKTKRLLELSSSLMENFDSLRDHMSYLKARHMIHRELTEQTFERVVRYNVAELLTLLVITIAQIMNVRRVISSRQSMM